MSPPWRPAGRRQRAEEGRVPREPGRKEWKQIADAQAGDTLPDWAHDALGPYEPPFDRCDREDDIHLAYEVFQDRLEKNGTL